MITLDGVRGALAIHRPKAARHSGARQAAVALVLVPGARGPDLLFIRRAVRSGDPWSGQIALPGGRRDPADADLAATAVRETSEELAVELAHAERLGALADLRPSTRLLPPVVVRPFVFALPDRPPLVPSAEVQSAFWAPLERFLRAQTRRDVTLSLPGGKRTFPAFVLGDDVIWGMTERIVTSLLTVLSAPR